MLTYSDQLQARARTYALFSRLFQHGITAPLWNTLQAIPDLAATLPDKLDADQAAAAHYHTISDTVMPFESIFRDPAGLLGGTATTAVAEVYARTGYVPAAEADSLAVELDYLAFCCAAEHEALAAQDEAARALWTERQRSYLDDHLLGWLPPLEAALAGGKLPFYAVLGNLTLTLVADHRAALGEPMPGAAAALPVPPDLLGGDDTSLRLISRTLLTPPFSGFYLSRETISDLARARHLPRGFGQRRQMLRNLLETAGQYDSAPLLLGDLLEVSADVAARYQAQLATWPELAPWIRPWQEQLARTRQTLADMRALVSPAG